MEIADQTPVQGTTKLHELENVGSYPRPPVLEKVAYPIVIVLDDQRIVSTHQAYRLLETFHPPTYYIPPDDVSDGTLIPGSHRSMCEWKGSAQYFDVKGENTLLEAAAWCYPDPSERFLAIKGYVAFYCHPMDQCLVDGIEAKPQPGRFYGGWVTPWIVGPIKGAPGTGHW